MIFSMDRCPLCNNKLRLEILGERSGKVAFLYYCTTTEIVRNESDTHAFGAKHYENRIYQGGELAFMIIPPFELMHSSVKQFTSVRQVSAHEPKRIIFETTLLDWDYSQPKVIIDKIKLLTLFS